VKWIACFAAAVDLKDDHNRTVGKEAAFETIDYSGQADVADREFGMDRALGRTRFGANE
jgi:hypothetical protein